MPHDSSPATISAKVPSNDTTQPKADEPSLLADLAALISEIENAMAGSETLDARIHFGYRVATRRSPDISALLIEEGIGWPIVEAVLDEQIPPFTTSLDASLEGEDVTFVIRSSKRGRWGAMQKARCGEEVLAWAATEPLARRLAALRACWVDLEKVTAPEKDPPAPLPNPAPQTEIAAGEQVGEKDWEVLF